MLSKLLKGKRNVNLVPVVSKRQVYTQNDEELYIIDALSGIQNGRFLDIGAHDGVTFSSTRKLWELGWSGVYVEPAPDVLPSLRKNAGDNCEIIPVAIGTTNGKMEFFSSNGDMVGSLSPQHATMWSSAVNFTKTVVDVITVDELEIRVGTQFDFVGIDVEGINLEVFNQFDWKRWNPKCVCVEYETHKNHMISIMSKAGYRLVYKSSENLVFVK
jgi:FkbM family methyltransferase